ncbi:coiled-coil domain-containing protein 113 [Xyrichtys novacula]|uniref:Cilia- and flagella-associated protein 263 n=1 Tax=Xyrichtys novacula TaxID=13765 RepID=A0AAV1F747_XYRNO|nr:coiled-coil domain-containing protein 113 [Xyrichtys novacula]
MQQNPRNKAGVVCTLATMERELSLMEEKGKGVTEEEREDLFKRVQELKCSNAVLLAEIDLFERFISHTDSQYLQSQGVGNGPDTPRGSKLGDGGHGWRRKSHVPDLLPQLTMKQKLSLAQREFTEMQYDQEKLKQSCKRNQDNYRASMKESEKRLSEIRKAQKKFEHHLVRPLKNNMLDMKEPEKVLQYIQDKSQITQLERYHFKNKALKVQQKKIQQQLLQRRDAVKADYEIIFQEFDEPKIEKNLDELQASYLKVTRILNSQKGALQSVTQESTELSSDITNREQILARIEEKIQRAQEECLKAEALNQNLRRQIADYQAPSIMEYVHIKNKHKMLQQSIHTWERKVEVTEMAMKVHSRAWNTQRATFTPANSAEAGAGSGQHRIPVKLPHIVEHST